jgi:hypothetical protein
MTRAMPIHCLWPLGLIDAGTATSRTSAVSEIKRTTQPATETEHEGTARECCADLEACHCANWGQLRHPASMTINATNSVLSCTVRCFAVLLRAPSPCLVALA